MRLADLADVADDLVGPWFAWPFVLPSIGQLWYNNGMEVSNKRSSRFGHTSQ